MIKIIEATQYEPFKYTYETKGGVLTLTMNEETEVLDLTELEDGKAESNRLRRNNYER